jgi:hypothetical protein
VTTDLAGVDLERHQRLGRARRATSRGAAEVAGIEFAAKCGLERGSRDTPGTTDRPEGRGQCYTHAQTWAYTTAAMKRDEIEELLYITPMENLPSMMKHGILCHNKAKTVPHQSVAMDEIQDKRRKVTVPGGRPLHDYANLYFCARNPMMYKRKGKHLTLCVLRVDECVLDIEGAAVTDSNASSDHRVFRAAPGGVKVVDKDLTFAEWWTDPDEIQQWRKSAAKCAEVLVPSRVPPRYIIGAYVSCEAARQTFTAYNTGLTATINAKMFFR